MSAEVLRALKPLADLQAGVVTREQASGHGVSPRLVSRLLAEGHWRRIDRGVFLTADIEPSFVARAWAGTLLGGDDARVGRLAAARLHRLADEDPELITVLVPHAQRPAPRLATSSSASELAPAAVRSVDRRAPPWRTRCSTCA
jgi:predicted transcriptional regulator of viral defense system